MALVSAWVGGADGPPSGGGSGAGHSSLPAPISEGGTGATTPSGALANLGAAPESWDAVITAGAGALSTAIGAGAKSILMRTGTYTESANVDLPEGFYVKAEEPGGVTLDFGGGAFSLQIDGTGGVAKDTTGTIECLNGSTTVTGTGTGWDVSLPDPTSSTVFVRLGEVFHKISARTATTITLENTYHGEDIAAGSSYVAQVMASGGKLEHLIIQNSTNIGLDFKGLRHAVVEGILVDGCAPNIRAQDCGGLRFDGVVSKNSGTSGMNMNGCAGVSLAGCELSNNATDGLLVDGDCKAIFIDHSFMTQNDSDGLSVEGTSTGVHVSDSTMSRNDNHGAFSNTTTGPVKFSNCLLEDNGVNGVQFGGANNTVSDCHANRNGAHGIQCGNGGVIAGCQVRDNVVNGINMFGDSDCTVIGNHVVGNVDGIDLNSPSSDNNVIVGNRVTGNSGYGIHIEDTSASRNVVIGNRLSGNTLGNFRDLGEETIVAASEGAAISPAALSANTDDWNPPNLETATLVRVFASAGIDLTGLGAPVPARRVQKTLINVGPGEVNIKDNDPGSVAGNRILAGDGGDRTFKTDESVVLEYDVISSRWRITARNA